MGASVAAAADGVGGGGMAPLVLARLGSLTLLSVPVPTFFVLSPLLFSGLT